MRELKVSELYQELFTEHKSHIKVAEIILDVVTQGMAVMWDDATRLKSMKTITEDFAEFDYCKPCELQGITAEICRGNEMCLDCEDELEENK